MSGTLARSTRIDLKTRMSRVRILPEEGGCAVELMIGGREILARTPWAGSTAPYRDAADDEETWVSRWRGGWNLCFPTTGQPDPIAIPVQGFHGTASQAPWTVSEVRPDAVRIGWAETPSTGLRVVRTWTLRDHSLSVESVARNEGSGTRALAIAEHLVLGSDILEPAVERGTPLRILAPGDSSLASLDYAGVPSGRVVPWPGSPAERWPTFDAATPARVAAILGPDDRIIAVIGPEVTASVSWTGLPHALLWEEARASTQSPWHGRVLALGVEPTTTPHGAGTAGGHGGLIALAAGDVIRWSVSLAVREAVTA